MNCEARIQKDRGIVFLHQIAIGHGMAARARGISAKTAVNLQTILKGIELAGTKFGQGMEHTVALEVMGGAGAGDEMVPRQDPFCQWIHRHRATLEGNLM